MGAAAGFAGLGLLLLAGLASSWVPRHRSLAVSDSDIDRDFSAAERARESTFRRRVRPWGLASLALGVLVPTVAVASGAASALAAALPGPWWVVVLDLVGVVLVVTRLLTIPAAVVVRRESLAIGLAAGPWSTWLRDLIVGFALSFVMTGAALLAWVGAARSWPQSWWLLLAAGAGAAVVVVSFLVPVVIEPLFARFSPMPDSPLRYALLALAAADGVTVGDVLVADASRRTTALNAYVSGLGATRRIVVHDTLLDRGADDEVRAVVAHELGHVVAHDVRTGTVLGAVGAATAVAGTAALLSLPAVLEAMRLTGPDDPAVAVVLLAWAAWAGLLTAPVQNGVSRRIERRADQHCLDRTLDASTVAAMHRSLAVTNVGSLRPPRLLHLWFGTHPTSPERIAAARSWASEHGVPVPAPMAPDA